MERSVDLVVVRGGSDPTGAVPDLSVDGFVVPPSVLFLRSLMRRPSELPREPAATGEPAVRLSVNDSVVLGDAEGTDFATSPAWAESVTEFCGRVPDLVENRSNLEVVADRSVTDGL